MWNTPDRLRRPDHDPDIPGEPNIRCAANNGSERNNGSDANRPVAPEHSLAREVVVSRAGAASVRVP